MKKREYILQVINEQEEEFHSSKISGLTGASKPYVDNVIISLVATDQLEELKRGRKTYYKPIKTNEGVRCDVSDPQSPVQPQKLENPMNEFNVKERFDLVSKFVQLVIEGRSPSMFLTGAAGIGKTFLVKKQMTRNGLKDPTNFVYIKGHSSPLGLYSILFHNREKIVVFDDCDKAWENELSANILKAALDSYDTRTIHWISRSIPKDSELENQFDFKGKIIFVSNKPLEEVDEAIRSRTMCVNLEMSRAEVSTYMRTIIDVIEPKAPLTIKTEVLDFLESIEDTFKCYNLRTFIKAIRVRERYEDELVWKNMIRIASHSE